MLRSITATLCFAIASTSLMAQEANPSKPTKQHVWLKKFKGSWTTHGKTVAMENSPVMECSGTIKSKMVGDFFVTNTIKADMNGMTFTGVQTIGYDPAKKKYIGTWIDSMTDYMWNYEGLVDKSGMKLTMLADGPNMLTGKGTMNYRDSYEFKSNDKMITKSEVMMDGKWVTFMEGEATRTSK